MYYFKATQPVFAQEGYAGHASPFGLLRGCATRSPKGEAWWSQAGSNRRPLACHASALPAELWPLSLARGLGDAGRAKTLNTVQGRSQVSSSPPTSPIMSVTSSSPSSSSAMKVESSSSSSSMVSSISMSSSDSGTTALTLPVFSSASASSSGTTSSASTGSGTTSAAEAAAAALARAAASARVRGGGIGAIGTISPV